MRKNIKRNQTITPMMSEQELAEAATTSQLTTTTRDGSSSNVSKSWKGSVTYQGT